MPKKIIFTVTNDLSYDQRMHRICAALHDHGYLPSLVGRLKKESLPLLALPYQTHRIGLCFYKGKLFYLLYNLKLFFYLLRSSCNAICAIDTDTLLACTLAAAIKRKPLFFDAHEFFTQVPELVNRKTTQGIWNLCEAVCLRHITAGYTVSNAVSQAYKIKNNIVLDVVRNMPYTTTTSAYSKPKTIVYQGAVNEGRGLEILIQAMQHIDAELLIAGDGDILVRLKNTVAQLQLGHKVTFTGYLLPQELKKYTATAGIGVNLLNHTSLSYKYSLANKFFDYVQAHVPQLCIGFSEYINLNNQFQVALLIPNLELQVVVNALNQLLNDTELYNTLKANTKKAARVWNWENESLVLLNFWYKHLPKAH